MDFIHFREATRTLGKPDTMTDAECGSLPVYADGRQCISCWQPTQAERDAIAAGLPVWLGVLVSTDPNRPAYTQPPVSVGVGKPDMPPVVHTLTAEIDEALQRYAAMLPLAGFADRPLPGEVLARKFPKLRTWLEGAPLEPTGKLYYVSSPEAQAVHLENLRDAYAHAGQSAVVSYLRPYVHFINSPDAQPAL